MTHIKRFNVKSVCPLCDQGARGVFRCAGKDNYKLVILCDECQAVWPDIHSLGAQDAVFPVADGLILEFDCFIYNKDSAWATKDDIKRQGWDSHNLLEEQ